MTMTINYLAAEEKIIDRVFTDTPYNSRWWSSAKENLQFKRKVMTADIGHAAFWNYLQPVFDLSLESVSAFGRLGDNKFNIVFAIHKNGLVINKTDMSGKFPYEFDFWPETNNDDVAEALPYWEMYAKICHKFNHRQEDGTP